MECALVTTDLEDKSVCYLPEGAGLGNGKLFAVQGLGLADSLSRRLSELELSKF